MNPEFASVFLDKIEQKRGIVDLNLLNQKHGYPLHIAILSHKFEIAKRLIFLNRRYQQVDVSALTTIRANIIHLLFVKYDKDSVLAYEILKECIRQKVNVNHIDDLKAAPIHVAMRKRQYQALQDCILINKNMGRQVFDFNIVDKHGQAPLHFSVEK